MLELTRLRDGGHDRGLNRRSALLGLDKVAIVLVAPGGGVHRMAVCQAATSGVLAAVFSELDAMGVDPRDLVLKPDMNLSGAKNQDQAWPAAWIAPDTLQLGHGGGGGLSSYA
jgi:hypothetical protein